MSAALAKSSVVTSPAKDGRQKPHRTMDLTGAKIAPGARFSPINDRDAAEEFALLVVDFSAGQLAKAACRSKETAKCWKAGRALPNGASLLNLAGNIPRIHDWVIGKISRTAPVLGSTNILTTLIASLQVAAQMPGADGAQARAVLAALSNGGAR